MTITLTISIYCSLPALCQTLVGPETKDRNKKNASVQGVSHAFGGLMCNLMGKAGILTSICNRITRCPARNNNSVFSRRTKDGKVNER